MQTRTKTPSYLQKGDIIGIVCPSGYLPKNKIENCINALRKWGFTVLLGKTVGTQYHYFAGTDDERLEDLQCMIDNVHVKAIICGRGGYGMSRIIDKLNLQKLIKHPKWIIGFSDITLLHATIFNTINMSSIHGPMVNAFNNNDISWTVHLRNVLIGKKITYACKSHTLNKLGNASGVLIGGNLTMLAHSVGTKSFFKKRKDYILFIEDIGEYLYSIDRLLLQLKRTGFLANLKGLIVGGFSSLKDTDIPFGITVEEIIYGVVKEYNYPLCFSFPISHETENVTVKLGLPYTLQVGSKKTILQEL